MSQTFDPGNPEQSGPEQAGHGAPAHGQTYPYGYPAPQG